jgi:hypothetical protein
MTWIVQLAGDTSDLAALAQSFTGRDFNISHDGQGYVLASARFAPSDSAKDVHQKAQEMVHILNGASCLGLDAKQPITVGSVHRRGEDGRPDIHVFLESQSLQLRTTPPTVRINRADGTVGVSHPADRVREWSALALSDDAVANVLRILASGSLDWVNLYRIWEIIAKDVGGLDSIDSKGWSSKAAMKLFKRTANSPGALGLEARHGAETKDPPAKPMELSEARTLINSIIHAWLRAKSSGPASS